MHVLLTELYCLVYLFLEPRTEQIKSDKEGYVYDFYYPSDNYGRLGDM